MKNNFNIDELAEKLIEKLTGRLADITLQIFINEHQAYVEKNRAPKTFKNVLLVGKHLLNYFSPLKSIQTITIKDAEQFLDYLKRKAPLGVYNYLRILKAMFNKGVLWNYLRENVWEKVSLPKVQQGKPTYVTEEQLQIILQNAESEVVKDVITTAFFTGCRLGELTNLTWQDVNLNGNVLMIGNSWVTKGRKQRYIPIHPRVKEILVRRLPKIIKREKHFVFCKSDGFAFTGDYFSKRFKRACRKAGIDESLHFHSLRHGAATKMILNGAPLPSVQRIMGHANIQTTMVYTHPDLQSLKDAINLL
ncbi:MAG: tyrosine-type recombinase/integrase [Ignavibacteriaceae bacterium]|nr:tyrosine-type recombinase/integrase [Ignavibacteriaceae bacterium]